jgi:hypothetical protein
VPSNTGSRSFEYSEDSRTIAPELEIGAQPRGRADPLRGGNHKDPIGFHEEVVLAFREIHRSELLASGHEETDRREVRVIHACVHGEGQLATARGQPAGQAVEALEGLTLLVAKEELQRLLLHLDPAHRDDSVADLRFGEFNRRTCAGEEGRRQREEDQESHLSIPS